MNSGVPITWKLRNNVGGSLTSGPLGGSSLTDLAKLRFFSVARPRSPIFTEPVVPVMKMLSHFRSRWMIGGERECRNASPFSICLHHDFRTFGLIFLKRRRYLQNRHFMPEI